MFTSHPLIRMTLFQVYLSFLLTYFSLCCATPLQRPSNIFELFSFAVVFFSLVFFCCRNRCRSIVREKRSLEQASDIDSLSGLCFQLAVLIAPKIKCILMQVVNHKAWKQSFSRGSNINNEHLIRRHASEAHSLKKKKEKKRNQNKN